MATVEDLPTGRVVGQYLFVNQDNEDAGTAPNAIIVEGYVRFTCSATPPLRYQNKKVSAVPLAHDAIFDSQGFLMPMTDSRSAMPGKVEQGLELLADAPGVNPRGFTWNVSFNLREVATGRTIEIPSFPIYVEADTIIDLTDVMPISEANGTRIIRGDSAFDIAEQAGFKGTMEEWLESLRAPDGLDAYQVAVNEGFTGTRTEWLESLKAKGVGYATPQVQMAPPEDTPTFEFRALSLSAAPSITGSAGWYREKRVGTAETAPGGTQTANGALDLTGSSYFSYPAVVAASNYAQNTGRLVISDMKPGGDAQYAYWLFNVEFVTSSPEIEFMINPSTANGRFGRVLVDGRPATERPISHNQAAGVGVSIKMKFPTAKERRITVLGLNNSVGRWGGVAVAPGHTIAKPKVRPARKFAFIGDSFVNGTNNVSANETFVWRLADLMGADEVLQAGIGGTSFGSGDVATRFANRIDAVLAYNPDVVVFAGGRNDSATGLQAEVVAALSRIPKTKEIYLISTASDATQAAVNDALEAGAKELAIPFIRADVDSYPREDAVHLTFGGHQSFADELYAKITSHNLNMGPIGPIGKTPNITIGTVTTTPNPADDSWLAPIIKAGPLTQQAMRDAFPTTMRGDRGETGIGWANGSVNSTHLDTLTTPGIYKQNDGAKGVITQGYPFNNFAGTIEVMNWAETAAVIQRATPIPSAGTAAGVIKGVFVRGYRGTGWSSWDFIPVQKIVTDAAGFRTVSTTDPSGSDIAVAGPGGLTAGATLPVALDLNTLLTPGIYHQPNSNAPITAGLNYPPMTNISGSVRGVLTVKSWNGSNNTATQEYEALGTGANTATDVTRPGVIYRRHYYNGFWSAWSMMVAQRVDNTAGRAIYTWDDTTNREQLIYGDTGWRNIGNEASLFINEFSATSVQLRRVGNYVSVNFDAMKSPTATGNAGFLQLPTGFRHDLANGSGNQRYGLASELSGGNTTIISPESTGGSTLNGILRFLSYVPTRTLHGSVSYYTRDPWPTSLPGTAIGTVTNN